MKFQGRYKIGFINALVAVAISLVVNFSFFVFALMSHSGQEGIPRRGWGAPVNDMGLYTLLQAGAFAVFAFILLWVMTRKNKSYTERILICVVISALCYFFMPANNRDGEIIFTFASRRLLNPMLTLKVSFTLIVAVLYGKIFELLYQKQHIAIENELLRNENLQTRYNMLISQMNPHFFFNSLNSLSMLVRGQHTDKALEYIDRLSDTFRYIIRSAQSGLCTLSEELEFLEAYKYVHEVRYAGKLFFDVDISPDMKGLMLPSLSLQPLVENAVKHNTITLARPFRIRITARDGVLTVSNPVIPKIDEGDSTGIGLRNLASRYLLLTGREIEVDNDGKNFTVRLPLIKAGEK